jgi:hypothetical protein
MNTPVSILSSSSSSPSNNNWMQLLLP